MRCSKIRAMTSQALSSVCSIVCDGGRSRVDGRLVHMYSEDRYRIGRFNFYLSFFIFFTLFRLSRLSFSTPPVRRIYVCGLVAVTAVADLWSLSIASHCVVHSPNQSGDISSAWNETGLGALIQTHCVQSFIIHLTWHLRRRLSPIFTVIISVIGHTRRLTRRANHIKPLHPMTSH